IDMSIRIMCTRLRQERLHSLETAPPATPKQGRRRRDVGLWEDADWSSKHHPQTTKSWSLEADPDRDVQATAAEPHRTSACPPRPLASIPARAEWSGRPTGVPPPPAPWSAIPAPKNNVCVRERQGLRKTHGFGALPRPPWVHRPWRGRLVPLRHRA